jgi:hypothetical protein
MFGSNSGGFCSTNEIGSSLGEAGAVYRGDHRLWGKAEIVDQSCQGAEGSIRRWPMLRKDLPVARLPGRN